ncbi:DUF2145 domain-containing protein [Ideonella paludis]|uniref:DUF2145 domain-containing protein n=1 Tax=Ideonella paludis TaxID=1233411 RepID=A0ABS5DUI4_9BURK|nr:DUF2145 domain-containing protein [Ideonella paludis]MBQ0934536.1 DUF2145 domain-containing protein [Ideonella paludis]
MSPAPRIAAVAVLLWAASTAALAGRTCEEKPLSLRELEQGLKLAETTAKQLDATGAQVLLLARAGQDLSKHGLQWSHLGFAYRPAATAGSPAPPWRVLHKLNQCGTDRAQLFRQGLGEFFLDRPHRYEAAYVVLSPEAQAKLLPLLQDNARLPQWHSPAYSMVAYPWSQRYQQSNQWALETLAGALEPSASTRSRAQAWLQFKGYEPTTLHLGTFTRLGARVTTANVAFDDHPNAKRFSNRIDTVTVDSMFSWTQRSGLSGSPQVIR